MINKKRIKIFEEFTTDELQHLESLDKTYLKYIKSEFKMSDNLVTSRLYTRIRNYDISTFDINATPYQITITPDSKFKEILNDINIYLSDKIDLKHTYNLNVITNLNNLVEFEYGIPKQLRGLSLGYKIYKLIINKFEYITSDFRALPSAINIWHHLMLDIDLLCYTSIKTSGSALKTISNDKLKKMLDYIPLLDRSDVEFDKFLIKRIENIYGSLHTYKQEQ